MPLSWVPFPRAASGAMSVTSEKTGRSLTQEILSHLGLAHKVGAARPVGTIFT